MTNTIAPATTEKTQQLLAPPGGGRFEAIIFDMGSTLLEFENISWPEMYRICVDEVHRRLIRLGHTPPDVGVLWERFGELMERRRIRFKGTMREYSIGRFLKRLVTVNGIRLRPGELDIICNAYYAPISRAVTMYPDARATLQTLHAAGYTLGLLSNTPFRVKDHRGELEMYGLWEFLSAAVFTSTLGYRKPHPGTFQEVARRLGVDLTRCLYVGDRQKEDILGPQDVGMVAVLVRRPHRSYEEGLTDSPEIDSLSELPALIGIDS
jgi:HAD superfamily hydrolase (TIGR01662 family)